MAPVRQDVEGGEIGEAQAEEQPALCRAGPGKHGRQKGDDGQKRHEREDEPVFDAVVAPQRVLDKGDQPELAASTHADAVIECADKKIGERGDEYAAAFPQVIRTQVIVINLLEVELSREHEEEGIGREEERLPAKLEERPLVCRCVNNSQ